MAVHEIGKAKEHLRRQELLQQVINARALQEVRDEDLGAQEVGQMVGRVLGVLVDLLHQVVPCVRLLVLELVERDLGRLVHVAVGYIALAEVIEVRESSPDVDRIPLLLVTRDHLVAGKARILLNRGILAEDDAERGPDVGRGAAGRRGGSQVRRHYFVLIAVAGVENNFT